MERMTNAIYAYAIPNAMKALSLINSRLTKTLNRIFIPIYVFKILFDMFNMSCQTYKKHEILSDIKGKNKINSDVSFMYSSMIEHRISSSTYKR